jgi:hypothetical protein
MTIDSLLSLDASIRYVALYRNGTLQTHARNNLANASDSSSDRFEELVVNPAILTLATQRGNIDCGGCRYVVIRYGNFFQLIIPTSDGHVSVAVESDGDPVALYPNIQRMLSEESVQGGYSS